MIAESIIGIIKKEQPQVLFFDCFDTILHRKIHSDEMLLLWSKTIIDKYKLNITPVELLELRFTAFKSFDYIDNAPTLYMAAKKLYAIFSRNLPMEVNSKQFAKDCISIEVEIEKKRQVVDNETQMILQFAHNHKIPCYIVSDFYLGKEVLREYLRSLDLGQYFTDIFVSCDLKKRKDKRGEIYPEVCRRIDILPKQCMMIGDNYKSDFENAIGNGLKAIHKPYTIDDASYHGVKWVNNRLDSVYNLQKKLNPYSGFAWTYFLFTDRLYKQLKRRQAKNVFFFAREGQFLKKLFDKYCFLIGDSSIESHYLYVSRLSTYIASLRDIEFEDFHIIKRQYADMSILSFLKNIGMDCDQIPELKNKNIEVLIPDFFNSTDYRDLIHLRAFRDEYEKSKEKNHMEFLRYFSTFNIPEDEELHIVDIGWKGTIQDNIDNIFGNKKRIYGYYIGLSDFGDSSTNNRKEGLIFERYPQKSRSYNVWQILESYLFENMIQADHAQTVGYEHGKPILKDNKINVSFNIVKPVLDDIETIFEALGNVFNKTLIETEDVYTRFERVQFSTAFDCSTSKLKILYSINKTTEEDSFGTFGKSRKQGYYVIARAVKHYGLWDNKTVDIIFRSRKLILTLFYSKAFCCLNRKR